MEINKIRQKVIAETLKKFEIFIPLMELKKVEMPTQKEIELFLSKIDTTKDLNYIEFKRQRNIEGLKNEILQIVEDINKKKEFEFKDDETINSINQPLPILEPIYLFRERVYLFAEICFMLEFWDDHYLSMVTIGVLKKSITNYPEKYYAFYHLMLVHDLQTVKEFERDKNDKFNSKEIQEYGKTNYGTGQQFYREYLNIYDMWHNQSEIAKHLRAGYKNKIIEISGNDSRVISKLKDYPN